MYKIINLLFAVLILLFFFSVYNYYSSNKNIKNINLKRSNIQENLSSKTSNLPFLENDTNNVIEFNSSFSDEIKSNEQRNFWNLLKIK
ncbi:hypothetical protein IDG78_04700 [Pelagibacterales bacterium SAG-MED05]|nr:hypothetical protein [Pelagibacterales bacterium SAG-MED05]|tara:strand:- start:342 stop:605 length:264 start_codon:yes stop_codon:yes gene_type:complete